MKRPSRTSIAWAVLVLVIAPAAAWLWAGLGHGAPRLATRDVLLRLGLYAVLEEIVFRGALQRWLAQQRALAGRQWIGISAANALTSLLFAAAHGFAQPALQAAAIFPVSLVLGLALEHSRSLAAPVLLHLYFNGLLWAASVALSSP